MKAGHTGTGTDLILRVPERINSAIAQEKKERTGLQSLDGFRYSKIPLDDGGWAICATLCQLS